MTERRNDSGRTHEVRDAGVEARSARPTAAGLAASQAAVRAAYRRLRDEAQRHRERLPSYWALVEDLRELLEEGGEVGIVVIGLRNLEEVEEVHGWRAADEVLAAATESVRQHAGNALPPGTVLAQEGVFGEELLVAVPVNGGGAARTLDHHASALETAVAEALRTQRVLEGWELRVASGHAELRRQDNVRFERLVGRALARAHAVLRDEEDRLRLRQAAELRRLLRERSLLVAHQPIVELATRRVVGHEALCRGLPDTAFEAADALFAASYEHGLERQLDALCRDLVLARPVEADAGGLLFLNVLPESLTAGEMEPAATLASLRDHGISPTRLVLEIAERGQVLDYAAFRRRLAPLRDAGMRVAIDDIGTGYSSLRLVPELEPDYLKVDVSLIKDLPEEPVKQGVLATIADLARRLGAAVIAEGIETEAELRAVVEHGVTLGQGYLLGPPRLRPGRNATGSSRSVGERRR